MELTFVKQHELWFLYEKTKNEKIPRGKIEFLPQLHLFKISFNKEEIEIHILPENNKTRFYKLSVQTKQYRGIFTEKKIIKKLMWTEHSSEKPYLKTIQKLNLIVIYENQRKIASCRKKTNNYFSLILNNEINVEPSLVICSFSPFLF